MTDEPVFITFEDALFFHKEEIRRTGGISGIRDQTALEAALGAPKASFGGAYLMNLFEMAATYVGSFCANHPFLDGNKRAGTACALTFLYSNGYEVDDVVFQQHSPVYFSGSFLRCSLYLRFFSISDST